jgi:hypothetical protein
MSTPYDTNRNAVIKSVETHGNVVTSTERRDLNEPNFVVFSSKDTNSTQLNLELGTSTVTLTGRQARTLYRLLQKHYIVTNKTICNF